MELDAAYSAELVASGWRTVTANSASRGGTFLDHLVAGVPFIDFERTSLLQASIEQDGIREIQTFSLRFLRLLY